MRDARAIGCGAMIVTTSWDDGDVLDERLADLLDRHGLRGTFYMARNHRPRTLSGDRIRRIAQRHEIGAHTLNHPDLTLLSRQDKQSEITGSRKWLEDVTGAAVPMFCYPFGRFDAETKRAVAEAGFGGARTTHQFVLASSGVDPFAMGTTLQVHPATLRRSNLGDFAKFMLHPVRDLMDLPTKRTIISSAYGGWSKLGASILERRGAPGPGIFHLWGHSWEINQFGMWDELDAFLRLLGAFAEPSLTNGGFLIHEGAT